MTTSRAKGLAAFERWASNVAPEDLVALDTSTLQTIAGLAAQRESVEAQLRVAVGAARGDGRSWSEIGAMLGVTKQAAQRRYAHQVTAA